MKVFMMLLFALIPAVLVTLVMLIIFPPILALIFGAGVFGLGVDVMSSDRRRRG